MSARSALECGSSSYRLPTSVYTPTYIVNVRKAVAAATALQDASRILDRMEPVNPPTDKLLRPTWVEISLSKLRRNFQRVRALAGARKVMAVIKADAYGHGAVPVSQCLAACGVDWFGVATVEEAMELRAAGVQQPVLLLGGLYMSDPAHLIEYRLTPSISSSRRSKSDSFVVLPLLVS